MKNWRTWRQPIWTMRVTWTWFWTVCCVLLRMTMSDLNSCLTPWFKREKFHTLRHLQRRVKPRNRPGKERYAGACAMILSIHGPDLQLDILLKGGYCKYCLMNQTYLQKLCVRAPYLLLYTILRDYDRLKFHGQYCRLSQVIWQQTQGWSMQHISLILFMWEICVNWNYWIQTEYPAWTEYKRRLK